MSRFRFELAGPADDADLRHVLAATPMAGRIAVRFQREPSWFAGAVVDGRWRQVVACRDGETGGIIGFGCRSLRDVYLNGGPDTVGYLSSLRVLQEYRNRGLVARGYAFFRRLHQDGRAPFYLTTIAAGNDVALRVLTSGRAGLPAYHLAGSYHTLALALPRRPRRPALPPGVSVRPARGEDLPAVLDFLAEAGPRRQFFPCYRGEDFLAADGLLCGLGLDRVMLAERAGRLVGTLAGWDQHAYRQSVVEGYRGWLRWLRPLVNAAAWLRGLPGLPAPGGPLRYLTAALPVVAGDDSAVFTALLAALRRRCARGTWSHLLLGLHESDPLLRAAEPLASACYTTHLYLVCWQDGEPARAKLDARPPYLELGSL
jgi:hypothetical protein